MVSVVVAMPMPYVVILKGNACEGTTVSITTNVQFCEGKFTCTQKYHIFLEDRPWALSQLYTELKSLTHVKYLDMRGK